MTSDIQKIVDKSKKPPAQNRLKRKGIHQTSWREAMLRACASILTKKFAGMVGAQKRVSTEAP